MRQCSLEIEVQRISCFTSPKQVQVKWLHHLQASPTGIQLLDGDQYRMAGISWQPDQKPNDRLMNQWGKKGGGVLKNSNSSILPCKYTVTTQDFNAL